MKLSVTVITLLSFSGVLPTPASAQVPGEVAVLVENYCVHCHRGNKAKAGLDLRALKYDATEPGTLAAWVRVHDKMAAGEMPPEDEDQPSSDELRTLRAKHPQPA